MPGRLGWVGLAIAVVAGMLVGFAGSTLLYRYRILRVPGEPVIKRIVRELDLTASQRQQIFAIIRETHRKVRALRRETHREFIRRREEIFHDSYLRIRAILTPEQQKRLDKRFIPPWMRRQAEKAAESPTPAASPTPAP